MVKFIIEKDYITLGQFLKSEDFVCSGGMVKDYILENEILINGIKETKRGKKIYPNDKLIIEGKEYLFIK